MKLIAIDVSRLLNLYLATRLKGQLYLPDACRLFVDRYRFASVPQTIKEMTAEPIVFAHGVFNDSAIDEFKIFSDGVVVSAKASTDKLDEFLSDLTHWSKSTLGMERVETHTVSKMYESHILFESKHELLRPFNAFSEISGQLSDGISAATGLRTSFGPFGMIMAADGSDIPGLKPIAFRIERKLSLEFSKGFYVSAAPLRTRDHLAVIEKLELAVG